MKITDINRLLCCENLSQSKKLLYPFVLFRDEKRDSLVPVWLEIFGESEPSDAELIRRASLHVTIDPRQTLKQWRNLTAVESPDRLTVSYRATAYTAHHWAQWASKEEREGEFQILKGYSDLGWVFGTYSDTRNAANLFLKQHANQ